MSDQPPLDDTSETRPSSEAADPPAGSAPARTRAEPDGTASANREWLDEDMEDDWSIDEAAELMADSPPRWPLGLVAATVIALFLLGFGGYGVVQERGELREEISRLQAELASSAQPAETAQNRQALRRIERRNDELRAAIANLELENQRLQGSLSAQRPATSSQDPTQGSPAARNATDRNGTAGSGTSTQIDGPPPVKSATRATTATPTAATTPATAGWFVNFSSYSQRSAAESWAQKLRPTSGTVAIVPGVKNNTTFYRVRVVGLENKAQATAVARALEQQYKLSGLWVGEQ